MDVLYLYRVVAIMLSSPFLLFFPMLAPHSPHPSEANDPVMERLVDR